MKLKRLLGACVVLPSFVLSGCQSIGMDYFRPKQTLPSQYQQSQEITKQEAIPNEWWKLYQDEVLDELIKKAIENNTDIKIAVARIEEADGYLREVGAALFPQVNIDSSASRYKVTQLGSTPLFGGISPTGSNFNIKLGTTFELDFWGKLRRAQESAKAEALGSRFAKDTVDLSLKSLVTGDYLLLRSLESQIKLSKINMQIREDSLALTKRRLEGGVSSALDVYQAEVAYTNLRAQLADLIRQHEIIRNQLAILTGDLELKVPEGDVHALPIPPVPPLGLPSALLDARPDIRQAEQNLIAANAKIAVAKAALFPTISLTAGFGGESKDLGDVLKSASRIWNGGLSLNLPIFDSGRLNSKVDQASAQQKQLLATYERAIQNGFEEVNNALINLRQNTERENSLYLSQQSASNALEIANNRYKSGYTGYLDVLDAQRVFNDASLAYVQSRQSRLTSTVELFKALGGGWSTKAPK